MNQELVMYECLEDNAEYVASVYHGNQKYGEKPYIHHINTVVNILKVCGETDYKVIVSAYLHDILEDTDCTEELILDKFGESILDTVKALTNDKDFHTTCLNIQKSGLNACKVKIADRIANMMASLNSGKCRTKYLKQHKDFEQYILNNDVDSMTYQQLGDRYWFVYSLLSK